MTAITNIQISSEHKALRPFRIHKDLDQVADLIELCFASNLDPDGKRYLRQMRTTARQLSSHYLPLLASLSTSLPISGYVWEENDQIIGNLSLIPLRNFGRRMYLIANVAVHPDYRQQGIAKALTKAALGKVRRLRGDLIWLQVRENNPAAIHLYRSIGFEEVCRRTTWEFHPKLPTMASNSGDTGEFHVKRYQKQHWEQQKAWLNHVYPKELHWHIHIRETYLKPGMISMIRRFVDEVRIYQCSVFHQEKLAGVVTWQCSPGHSDHLWIASEPENEADVIRAALKYMIQHRKIRRRVVVDHPKDRSREIFEETGFQELFTLLWMRQPIINF